MWMGAAGWCLIVALTLLRAVPRRQRVWDLNLNSQKSGVTPEKRCRILLVRGLCSTLASLSFPSQV